MALFFLWPQSLHGSIEPTLLGVSRSVLIGAVLLSIATLSSVGTLVLYFKRQRTWRKAVIAALGSFLAFVLLVFGIGWVIVSIRGV